MKKSYFQGTSAKIAGLLILTYIFSIAVRMIWYYHSGDNASFFWNQIMMINTNDGYFFATGAKDMIDGTQSVNPRVPHNWAYGLVPITALVANLTSMPLETVILYLPAVVSSLVVIPIILIALLYRESIWGFVAALIGAVAWSYYNRTMMGYYDTDMFSAMAPMFILYFLIKNTQDMRLNTALFGAFAITIYPFLYDQGLSIVYAIGIIYITYMAWFHKNNHLAYKSLILILISLLPIPWIGAPYSYILKLLLVTFVFFIMRNKDITSKNLQIASVVLFLVFIILGNVPGLILSKIYGYITTGTAGDGLQFLGVNQTISEANKIDFFPNGDSNIAQRLSGSSLGFIISIIGYVWLVTKRKEFVLALPLMGIAIFAHWGGLRFTVYAVPVAALSATYLLMQITKLKNKQYLVFGSILFVFLAMVQHYDMHHIGLNGLLLGAKHLFSLSITGPETRVYEMILYIAILILFSIWALIYLKSGKTKPEWIYVLLMSMIILFPNITHVTQYNPGTVMSNAEVRDLDKLKKISNKKDYTLSWWDYGYAIWYYSDTSTLIDGGKHNNDNFIISKMLQTDSSELMAGLGRLAVETYAKSEKIVANEIFDNEDKSKNPNKILRMLSRKQYPMPAKTRDIYLYLNNKMVGIFPTIIRFGNLNLKTGKKLGNPFFFSGYARQRIDSRIVLAPYLSYDLTKGSINYAGKELKIKSFIVTDTSDDGTITKNVRHLRRDGRFSVIYVKNLNKHLIMDNKTLDSMFVKMYILGEYDKDRFELVISSKSSRVYKFKQ